MINNIFISNKLTNLQQTKNLLNTKCLLSNVLFLKNFSYTFYDKELIKFNKKRKYGKDIPFIFYSSSSSIVKHHLHENRYILNVRCVNYRLFKNTKSTLNTKWSIGFTINHILILDDFFKPIGRFIYKNKISEIPYIGIEDIRLFNFKSKLYYLGSVYDSNTDTIQITSNEHSIFENYKINVITPSFETSYKNEKNWVFFENNDEMFIIYKWYPIYVCKIDYKTNTLNLVKQIQVPKLFENFRGSTNGVLWNNKIWFIIHTQNSINNIKYYTHNFVVLNSDLTVYGYTDRFNFEKYLVEFCVGMTTRNNNFVITYSTLDSSTKLCEISCDFINSLLIKV